MRSLLFLAAFAALTLFHPAYAATRPVDCTLIVDGKTYINGVCEFVASDRAGSFSIYGDKYWASVQVEDGKGDAHWNEAPYATHAQTPLGEVRRTGGCWEGAKVRICALALDPGRREAIMGRRPKGVRMSPEHADYLCVSAPDYRFVDGAALMMDRCDFFWGTRQQVFSLSDHKVSLSSNPELCIDAQASADSNNARLVIDDCARVAIRWTYDEDKKVIRSSDGLCWDFRYLDRTKQDDWPHMMIVHPCEQDAEKNGRFEFSRD